jgi:hypothetical protein
VQGLRALIPFEHVKSYRRSAKIARPGRFCAIAGTSSGTRSLDRERIASTPCGGAAGIHWRVGVGESNFVCIVPVNLSAREFLIRFSRIHCEFNGLVNLESKFVCTPWQESKFICKFPTHLPISQAPCTAQKYEQ